MSEQNETPVETVQKADRVHTHLLLSQLIPGSNIRKETPDVAGMKETIKRHGIIQPLLVRAHRDPAGDVVPDKYDLVAGYRRYAAAKELHLAEVPVHFVDADDAKRHEMALIENLQRADMNPLEKAEGIQKMVEGGMSQKEVAAALGMTEGFVSQHMALLKLPSKVKGAVQHGKIELSQARELYRLHDHEDKMLELLPSAQNMTITDLKSKVDVFLEKEKTKAEKQETKAASKSKKKNGEGEEEAAPKRREKKSLAEQYADAELAPLNKTAMREELQALAIKMERAKTDEARAKYKWMLAGMEIAAGMSKE